MEQLEKADRKTFRQRLDRMVETIRGEIASGVWREGDFLPSEKAYAKLYRLSNNTVRKGLEQLVAERLIEKVPRVGNKVTGQAAGQTVLKFCCHVSLLQEAAMHTLIAEFHKANPDVRVEMSVSGALNAYDRVKPMIDEGAVDVFTMNYNGFDDFRVHGGFDDVETLSSDPRIYPVLTEAFTHENRLKAQPLVFTPLILCYNKEHFRQKELLEPDSGWRWNMLFDQASKLTVENERLGFYFHFPSSNRWPVFLLQSGVRFKREEAGGFSISGEQLAESLRACRQLIYLQNRFPLFLSEKDADAEELFFSGKVSMIMTTYLGLNHHERKAGFEYDVAPLPYLQDPKTLLLLVGLAVSANSKVKDAAKRFVDFLVSYPAQLMIRQKTLSIPSLKPAAEWSGKETVYHPPRFHMYREILPTLRPFSALSMSIKELERFYREAKLYWSGLETEEAAVERLERFLASLNGGREDRQNQS